MTPPTSLTARDAERLTLDRLLGAVRDGESRVLVLRGEAGVGKSALLEYMVGNASGCRVLRAEGVELEMELAYASLHQLCAPVLERRDHLPDPQRDALATAFGLSAGPPPDRFVVGLAVLGLLTECAEEQPLVCVVDDAQWLDQASAQTLAFVARRLFAEPVGIVLGVREPSDLPAFTGLENLPVVGLDEGDARALLDSALAERLDERVRDLVVAEARGNPLALLELPRGLTPGELAGGFGLPDVSLPNRIEQSFLRRLEQLPVDTRRLMLMAAAETLGDVTLLWRAAERVGLGPDAVAPAEAVDLLELGARARFRHPLVRSAIYRAATPSDRREAHRVLAEATDPETDPDRRAWHRAQSAAGLDEGVADELERSADRARRRGGVAAMAAFLERAAELSPTPARRGARALAAAQAKLDAGALESAQTMFATAELAPLDELQRARLARLRGQMVFAQQRGSDAPHLLLDAAKRFEPLDAATARETYVEAFAATIFAGRMSHIEGALVEAAGTAPSGPRPPRPLDLLLDGLVDRYTKPFGEALPALQQALHSLAGGDWSHGDEVRWLRTSFGIAGQALATELWDDEAWHELASRALSLAREAGALAVLPVALTYRAGVHLHAGEFAEASALMEEADAISVATGNPPLKYLSLMLLAWRGQEVAALRAIESSLQGAASRGEGRVIGLAHYATALLFNSLGRYQDALEAANRACAYKDPGFFGWALVELVEAGVRSDSRDAASDAFGQLDERTSASGTDWALGVRARSAALLSNGTAAEAFFREAIERLGRSRIKVHLARAHLVYGEWLRRENRRVDAREHLRAAHDTFVHMGAAGFAERARRELRATGVTARKRAEATRGVLTPQEAQVARLARDGLSNPEIGAQLFISPRTAQYHLHKVFAKLEITSRAQLGRVPDDRLTAV
jgi:DNA-binding CsgD family transcriptional regulator/tetratricopeptide (TPR) repeat protein